MTRRRLLSRFYLAAFCAGLLEATLLYRLHYVQHYGFIHLEILNTGALYALVLGSALSIGGLGLVSLRVSPAFLSAASLVMIPVVVLFRYQKYLVSFEAPNSHLGWEYRLLAAALVVLGMGALGALFRRFPASERIAHAVAGIATVAVLAGNAAFAPGFRESEIEITGGPREPVNVVWITSDALRADHLSVHGYGRETSPFLERFRSDAVFFRRNYSQCCWTQPSMISLFTSLYPFESFQMEGSLSPEVATVAQILARAGYSTLGLSNNEVVGPSTNLDRGFDVFYRPPRLYAKDRIVDYSTLVYVLDDFVPPAALDPALTALMIAPQRRFELPTRTEAALFERAANHLRDLEPPFFLYLHFMAPHAPYDAEPPWDDWGDSSLPPTDHLRHDARKMPPKRLTPAELAEIVWRYDREIRMLDDYVERLVEHLHELELYDDCLFVFTSDHGEEFLEHGEWTHGRALYNESVHVPLFIKLPQGRLGGTVVDEPTQGVDLLPTLLEVLGVEVSLPYALRGDALFRGGGTALSELGPRPIVLEFNSHYPDVSDQTAIIMDGYKAVHDLATGEYELYDIVADPGERSDLASVDRERLDSLRAILAVIIQDHHPGFYVEGPSPLEAQRIQEELRALGYIK